jgi:hypothetical protein
VIGLRVKVIASSVRPPLDRFVSRQIERGCVSAMTPSPREGDVVLARVRDEAGVYRVVENAAGREVHVYVDDVVVGVLGTRRSSANVVAGLPERPLHAGDVVQLVSVGGLVGDARAVPAYDGAKALDLEILGFPRSGEGEIVNLRSRASAGEPSERCSEPELRRAPAVAFFGTSAEAGKTTMACALIRALRRHSPGLVIGAVKIAGTGRLRDLLACRDAGAEYVSDFVDYGWPSTYNVPRESYRTAVEHLVGDALEQVDFLVIEAGGDLLEAHVPLALEWLASCPLDLTAVVVANDAMGAMWALERVRPLSPRIFVATIKQNTAAMSDRLGVPVIDAVQPDGLRELALTALRAPEPSREPVARVS